jgi:hypothetical protein
MAEDISTQIVREAPEIEAYKLGLLQKAQGLYGTPLNLPAVEAAQLSATQGQAATLAGQGIGQWKPYMAAGTAGVTQGQQLASQGAGIVGGMNVAPQFNAAQNATQAGIQAAGGVGSAANIAGNYLQANLAPSQGMLGQAAGMANQMVGAGVGAQQQGLSAVQQGISGLQQATRAYDPTQAAAFMNPYQSQVTDKALAEMRRQGDIAAQGTAAQAVKSGAFGGTREGVQRAEQERNLQDLMSQRTFQDLSANYTQAQNAAMTSAEQQQQRQLAASQGITSAGTALGALGTNAANIYGQAGQQLGNIGTTYGQQALSQAQLGQAGASTMGSLAGQQASLYSQAGQGIGSLAAQQAGVDTQRASTLGQLGSSMGAMGVQQAALGQAGQQLNAADVSLLSGIGALEQQNAQAQLDASRATRLQEAMTPYQQLAFVSDIYKGAPSSQMTLTSSSAPSASPLQSALGTVVGGVTTAAAASRAGLF